MQQPKGVNSVASYLEYKRTTAGWKSTYAYQKLIQILVWMIMEPEKAIVLGGTWRIPVLMGLQNKSFLTDQERDGTFNEAAFDREYESIWSGTAEGAFFNGEAFDRSRRLQKPEYEFSGRSSGLSYYVISVDVGRRGQPSNMPSLNSFNCWKIPLLWDNQQPRLKNFLAFWARWIIAIPLFSKKLQSI